MLLLVVKYCMLLKKKNLLSIGKCAVLQGRYWARGWLTVITRLLEREVLVQSWRRYNTTVRYPLNHHHGWTHLRISTIMYSAMIGLRPCQHRSRHRFQRKHCLHRCSWKCSSFPTHRHFFDRLPSTHPDL